MSSIHGSIGRESDAADQEIPDRKTAEAAKWLTDKKAGFDTPIFWLIASLLADFAALAVEREREAKDAAYTERDKLVCALSKLFPSALERHPESDTTWENDWRWIVFIDIPVREYLTYGDQRNGPGPHFKDEIKQVTWHIHDSELSMFDHLPRFTGRAWDGHTTPQKYLRLTSIRARDAERG